jgi:tyrosinase
MAGSMVYRLEVSDASAPHMKPFRAALGAAQGRRDNEGYNWIAGFHGAPGWYCWHHQINRRTPIQARVFLPWHRAYLWWLEQALQDRAPDLPANLRDADIALPWWDWTKVREIPDAYDAQQIDGKDNPLNGSRARVPDANPPIDHQTTRAPGANPRSRLPRRDEIRGEGGVLADTDWASFSDRLEDLHDAVHGWIGGDMRSVTTAAYDPIFFAHHCMIDRVWYLWQVKHGNGGIPRDLLDLELMPFGKRVRDVLDVQRLGYEYAKSATQIR